MYTLRTIFQTGIERNNFIGNDYEIVKKENKEDFRFYFDDLFLKPEQNDVDMVYALLITPTSTIPIYEVHKYYIVGSNGETFSKLTK